MKQKLFRKYFEGYTGWDNPSWTPDKIMKALKDHIEKRDMVDVANFAMFLWNKGE